MDMEVDFNPSPPGSSRRQKRKYKDFDSDGSSFTSPEKRKPYDSQDLLSRFEELPTEILHRIATILESDGDLRNFALACTTATNAISSKESTVWRNRFLNLYDHPFLESTVEFQAAYKIRQFVLANFVGFGNEDPRLQEQLNVLKEMVVESYHNPKSWPTRSVSSHNLEAFMDSSRGHWILQLFNSPFYAHASQKYGQPQTTFDALQVVAMHTMLSPSLPGALSRQVKTSRDNYNLTIIYNWDQPFQLLYRRLPTERLAKVKKAKKKKNTLFPNLRSSKRANRQDTTIYCELDLNSILHIRNFWQHVLTYGNSEEFSSQYTVLNAVTERHYTDMMNSLQGLFGGPRAWEIPLSDASLQHVLTGRWVGHYNSIYPWPRRIEELVEQHSSVEEWTDIDPLILDFTFTEKRDSNRSHWPPVFSTIPAFARTIPRPSSIYSEGIHYLRGIAPFFNLTQATGYCSSSTSADSSKKTLSEEEKSKEARSNLKYHPFNALRLHGVIHRIHDQAGIPSWHRIVLVMYRPSTMRLVQTLEHAEENYGNQFATVLSAQATNTTAAPATEQIQATVDPTQTDPAAEPTNDLMEVDSPITPNGAFHPQIRNHLNKKLLSFPFKFKMEGPFAKWKSNEPAPATNISESKENDVGDQTSDEDGTNFKPTPQSFSSNITQHILELDDAYSAPVYLGWDDIECAYAYEGIMTPGGKIMLGRWWRVGFPEDGYVSEGMEVNSSGMSVGEELEINAGLEGNENDNENGDGAEDSASEVENGNGDGNAVGESSASPVADDSPGDGQGDTTNQPPPARIRPRHENLERGPFIFWCQ